MTPRANGKSVKRTMKERKYWKEYTRAYEDALRETSTGHSPWYIIPSNNKWFRNLAISQIVVEKLVSLNLKLPKTQVDIKEIRRKYHQAVVLEKEKSK
jgi:polyphosphate kinase 2 (PPK2 family)